MKIVIIRNILNIKKKNLNKLRTDSEKKYLKIGYIGSYLKYKGVEDLILATQNLIRKGYKIKLYLAGDRLRKKNKYLNFFLNILNLNNNINFLKYKKYYQDIGHIDNLSKFYNKIDVLCFPSYLNALGRQVFEAAKFGLPSIVCLKKNKSDSFVNYKSGIAIKEPGNIKELENSIIFFYLNRKKIQYMGNNARQYVKKKFDTITNLKKLENIYKSVI